MQRSITLGNDGRWYVNGVPIDINDLTVRSSTGSNIFYSSKPPTVFKAGDKWISSVDGTISKGCISGDSVYWISDIDDTEAIRAKDMSPVLEELADVILKTASAIDYTATSASEGSRTTYPVISEITFNRVLGTSYDACIRVVDAKGYSTSGLRFAVYTKLATNTDYTLHSRDIAIGAVGTGAVIPITGLTVSTGYSVKIELYDKNSPSFTPVVKTATVTTDNAYIKVPTITISGYPDGITTTPTITVSAFTPVGATDTYASTTFRVKHNGSVIWGVTQSGVTVTIPAGILTHNTEYTVDAYHTGTTLGNSGIGTLVVTTANTLLVEYSLVAGGKSGESSWNGGGDGGGNGGNGGEVINSAFYLQAGETVTVVIGGSDTNSSVRGIVAISGKGAPGGKRGTQNSYPTAGTDGVTCIDGQVRGSSGGGGGDDTPGAPGGIGAGHGGVVGHLNGYPGTDGTGGGGGGGTLSSGVWGGFGPGATGILVIRYPGSIQKITGGTIEINQGYVYHTFGTSGTFTVTL